MVWQTVAVHDFIKILRSEADLIGDEILHQIVVLLLSIAEYCGAEDNVIAGT